MSKSSHNDIQNTPPKEEHAAQQLPNQPQKKKKPKLRYNLFKAHKTTDSTQDSSEPSAIKLKTVRSDANPIWLKPMMFTFLIVGFLWILAFYLTSGRIPVYELGNWNLLVGIGISMVGFFMMTAWR